MRKVLQYKGVLITLFCLFIFTGCIKNDTVKIELTGTTVEVNSIKDSCSCYLVKSVNGNPVKAEHIFQEANKIVIDKVEVNCGDFDNSRLGTMTITFSNKGKNYSMNIEVVDTIAPIILIDEDVYDVEEGNEYFNINNLFTVQDNYDNNVLVGITGHVDLNTIGTYQVLLAAKDSSGNTTEKSIIVNVVEKEKEIVTVGGSGGGNNNSGNNNNNNNSGNGGGNNSGGDNGNNGTTTQTGVSISGVNDVRLPVGASVTDLQLKLSQITISGNGQVNIDFSAVNLSAPGSYTVYYTSDGKIIGQCTVYVE